MDYVKGVDRNQSIMTSLDEMVHSKAFVRIIDAFLDSLDLWVIKKCEAQNATTYVLPKANAANKKYEVFGMEKLEISLLYTTYNLRRSVSILGFEEILRRLRVKIELFFPIFIWRRAVVRDTSFMYYFHLSCSVNPDGYRDDIPAKLNLKYPSR